VAARLRGMDRDIHPNEPPETFTKAPAVPFEPGARPPLPVRAAAPGVEPPAGLRLGDLGPADEKEPNIRPALLGEPFDDPVAPGSVRCVACAHRCVLRPSRIGVCGVRQNRGGRLYTLVYGQTVASQAEPIEKKPFFHFLPGSTAYSVATRGCNFHCAYCQNWQISQSHREGRVPESRFVAPQTAVQEALAAGVRSIAYTYVEPTIFLEYALDTMALARAAGLRNVFVTNGYESPEALDLVAPNLDAANVDFKAGSDDFYRRVCGARLEPVRETIVAMRRRGVWVELTTLVIPGLNDDAAELRATAEWIATAVGPETPWHLTRFQPAYRLSGLAETPAATLVAAAEIARESGLRHVYVGNAPEVEAAATLCAGCGERLIGRSDFAVTEWHLVAGRCPRCGHSLAGVGLEGEPVVV
jgi:pyruvate formate lyase activating enzyme